MTYPWTNPESHNAAEPGLDGDGRLNYLLYLETVGSHTPPKDSSREAVLSTRMGNWTEGRKPGIDAPSKFGSFVLSSANFMDNWILPRFSAINRIMSIDISDVTTWADDKFLWYYWRVAANFCIGLGKESEDKTTFKLKREDLSLANEWQDEAKNFLRPLTQSPGNGACVWTYKDIEWGNTAKHSYKKDGSVEVWMSGDSTYYLCLARSSHRTNISCFQLLLSPELTQWLAATRSSTREGRGLSSNIRSTPVYLTLISTESTLPRMPQSLLFAATNGSSPPYRMIGECKWKITLTLTEVTDGGMQINVDYEKPQTTYPAVGDMLDYIKNKLDTMYNTAYSNFEWYINLLRNGLQGQEKFTLPVCLYPMKSLLDFSASSQLTLG